LAVGRISGIRKFDGAAVQIKSNLSVVDLVFEFFRTAARLFECDGDGQFDNGHVGNVAGWNAELTGHLVFHLFTLVGFDFFIGFYTHGLLILALGAALRIGRLGRALSIARLGRALGITRLGRGLCITRLGRGLGITRLGRGLCIT
jgi:hypothetical protein